MKKMLILVPLLAAFIFGCTFFETIVGSGNLVEMQMGFADFTEVNVDAPFDVTLIHDADYSVSVMVDDNLVNRVEVDQSGSVLTIDLDPYYNYSDVSLKAVITMPVLQGVELSSASTLTVIDSASFPSVTAFNATVTEASSLLVSSIVANTLTVNVDGAASATIGALASDSSVSVDDASRLDMNGSTYEMMLNVSDASSADLADFATSGASVWITDASEAWISVNGVLDADITGASTLHYHGSVQLGYLNIEGASSFVVY